MNLAPKILEPSHNLLNLGDSELRHFNCREEQHRTKKACLLGTFWTKQARVTQRGARICEDRRLYGGQPRTPLQLIAEFSALNKAAKEL